MVRAFSSLLAIVGCSGQQPGAGGPDPAYGSGYSGAQHCWDLDYDGEADPEEDTNGDGVVDVYDCRGEDGSGPPGGSGADGQDCWDLDGDGVADPEEDTNGDGVVDVYDCRGDGGADTGSASCDADGDGFLRADVACGGADCDDADPDRYPGAPEIDHGLLEDPACDGGVGGISAADHFYIASDTSADGSTSFVRLDVLGDLNSDGFDDFVLADSRESTAFDRGGVVYVLLGGSIAPGLGDTPSRVAHVTIRGATQQYVGSFVAGVGDLDGDGVPELVVGGRTATSGMNAYLFLGSTLMSAPGGALALTDADRVFMGEPGPAAFGGALAAGDVDGDGFGDLLLMQLQGGDDFQGVVSLFLGASINASGSRELTTEDADYRLVGEHRLASMGSAMAAGEDLDGDGNDDFVVAAYGQEAFGTDQGRVYIVTSSMLAAAANPDLSLDDIQLVLEGAPDQHAGVALDLMPDLDGDGTAELLVTSSRRTSEPENGFAQIVRGSTILATTDDELSLLYADHTVTRPATESCCSTVDLQSIDFNHDGNPDLIFSDRSGSYLLPNAAIPATGDISTDSAEFTILGDDELGTLGILSVWRVTDLDFDGDGRTDLLMPLYRPSGGSLNQVGLVLNRL